MILEHWSVMLSCVSVTIYQVFWYFPLWMFILFFSLWPVLYCYFQTCILKPRKGGKTSVLIVHKSVNVSLISSTPFIFSHHPKSVSVFSSVLVLSLLFDPFTIFLTLSCVFSPGFYVSLVELFTCFCLVFLFIGLMICWVLSLLSSHPVFLCLFIMMSIKITIEVILMVSALILFSKYLDAE